jgi:hypothetical protein
MSQEPCHQDDSNTLTPESRKALHPTLSLEMAGKRYLLLKHHAAVGIFVALEP